MALTAVVGFVLCLVASISFVLLFEALYLKPTVIQAKTIFNGPTFSETKNKTELKYLVRSRTENVSETYIYPVDAKMSSLQQNNSQIHAKRFLLFTSAGDKNNVKQWAGPGRNYDIVVVYYGAKNFKIDVDELYIRKDTKFPNLKWYMQTHSIDKYKAIAVWDDDIVASVESINALFLEMITTDAGIFSPCHKRGSFSSLFKQQVQGVRDVRFIEMNAPMFLNWTLNDFMAIFDPILKGWGTDIWYSYRCKYILDECVMKVSGTTCVYNPKTRKDGSREINKAQPENVRLNTWVRFAHDALHQPNKLPRDSYTNTIGWQQFCKQNLKSNLTFAKYADKINVKKIVHKSNLNIKIPTTYATVTDAENITLKMIQTLPNKYVFKASHGSYMTVIVNNNSFVCHGFCATANYFGASKKAQLDFLKRNCYKWLSIDFGKINNERHYSEIPRQCFFEEMIPHNNDFKVHIFHGKPAIIEVLADRFKNISQTFYTPSWRKIEIIKTIPEPATIVEKPDHLREMLQVAEQLTHNISFICVDLYISELNVVFSKLTISPDGCLSTYSPQIADTFYGALAAGGNQDPESIISLLK